MTVDLATANTTEHGWPGGIAATWSPVTGQGWVAQPWETTPELTFPLSAAVYDRMANDGQIAGMLRSIIQALLAAGWHLDGTGVDDRVTQLVDTELGVSEQGARTRRRRQGVVWVEHLREALTGGLRHGFAPFEQVYDVGPPGPGQDGLTQRNVAHLRKLAWRNPRTLTSVRVARDGGLQGIAQEPAPGQRNAGGPYTRELFIGVADLAWYVLDKQGADWTGTSLLRASYPHWLIKDLLLRLGPQAVERQGMGLPVVYYNPETTSRSEALALATAARSGAQAGAAIPEGHMRLELLGVTGTVRDELPLLRYHDQAMSRSTLQMFLNLGHDDGARSLGDTFREEFAQSLNGSARWAGETATEHIIRDLVEINFGPDEPYPVLAFDPLTSDGPLTADALSSLVNAGVILPDSDLEADIRRRARLPPIQPYAPNDPPPVGVEQPAPPGLEPVAATSPPRGLVDRAERLAGRLEALQRRQDAGRRDG